MFTVNFILFSKTFGIASVGKTRNETKQETAPIITTKPYKPKTLKPSPNGAQYSPNSAQYSPNSAQYSPNSAQYSPNSAQYSPNVPSIRPVWT